ncbi:hypothetical protein [Acidicapsa ligni]|uniref:hypothetical protein n=1 Tax=Acidicapsa ligni TaxID=542300 RepID=UPI0021E0290B|nr:hypothetical protein [Acidicapsa ligni]
MVVLTQDKRPGVVGLHVGTENAHQFFPHGTFFVELELDHLRIVCTLDPSFWLDRPVIHDLRLSSWLDSKRTSGKLASRTAQLSLIPSGPNAFRLQPLETAPNEQISQGTTRTDIPHKTLPAISQLRPTPVVSIITERRRRSRVAKLKIDDRTSTSATN